MQQLIKTRSSKPTLTPYARIAGVNVTAPLRHDVAAPQVVDFAARSREQASRPQSEVDG